MAAMTATPFFVYNELGRGAAASGAFGAAQMAAYAAMCIVSSRFVERARNGLDWALLGLTVFAVSYTSVPFFRHVWVCGALSAAAVMAMALVWPALHSWVGAEPDLKRRAYHMGWFNISWSFGFALSPLLAGPLYDWDYRLPFLLLLCLCVAAAALIKSLPHEKVFFKAASVEMLEARRAHDRASEVHLYAAWCATFVINVLAGVTRSVFPRRIDQLVNSGGLRLLFEEQAPAFLTSGSATRYGWLAVVLSFTTAAAFMVWGRTTSWRHRFPLLLWLQAASAGAFWALGHTQSLIIMALCFLVLGAAIGVTFFASMYYGTADPAKKHGRAAVNEGLVGSGGAIGSMVFGYLVGRYGFAHAFNYTPVLVAGALAV